MAEYLNGQIAPNYSNFNMGNNSIPLNPNSFNWGSDANFLKSNGFSDSSVIPTVDLSNSAYNIGSTVPNVPDVPNTGKGFNLDWLNKDTMSTLSGLAQGAGSLWNAFNASKQFDLAKDQFKFSKGAFNANFANQAKLVNAQMNDRQRARIGGTGDNNASGQYESLASYSAKNNVNGAPI